MEPLDVGITISDVDCEQCSCWNALRNLPTDAKKCHDAKSIKRALMFKILPCKRQATNEDSQRIEI